MKDRGIYEVGRPFYIKVVFTGEEINQETDNILTKAMARGCEILPGLRLEAICAKFVDKDLLAVGSITDDLKTLRNILDDFYYKYGIKGDEIREEKIKKFLEEKNGTENSNKH